MDKLMDNPWIIHGLKKNTVKTIFLYNNNFSDIHQNSKTQLENEMQNVVASSGGKRHVNASSFSVYGFQCFVYCFSFFVFQNLTVLQSKMCATISD